MPGDNRYIATVPGRGYRFVADVRRANVELPEVVLQRRITTRMVVKEEEEDESSSAGPGVVERGALERALAALPQPTPETGRKRAVAVAAILVLAAAIVGGIYWFRARQFRPAPPRDTVVLADFIDSIGDPGFVTALRQELAIQLEQSPGLAVLSDQRVGDTLKLLQRDAHQPLTPDRAREVCRRTNNRAFVATAISNTGGRYLITLNAEDCASGNTLAGVETEAGERGDMPKALRRAAAQLAEKLRTALPGIPAPEPPLPDDVTGSLDAVQAFAQAELLDDDLQQLPYYRRAVEIDPDCALAYMRLGTIYLARGDVETGNQNLSRAYGLRNRVSPLERAIIEAKYSSLVTWNLTNAATAYEEWTRLAPKEPEPHFGLAQVYNAVGQYENAAEQARSAIALSEASGRAPEGYRSLLQADIRMGRLDEAEQVLAEAKKRNAAQGLFFPRYLMAFLRHDSGAMDEIVSHAMGKGNESFALFLQSLTEQYHGHMRKARQLTAQALESARHSGLSTVAATELEEAQGEADVGHAAWARQHVPKLSLDQMYDITGATSAYVLALAGDTRSAEDIAEKLDRYKPFDTLVQHCWLPQTRAAIALDKDDPNAAIRELMTAAPYDFTCQMAPVYVRGRAYLAGGRGKEAAAEFQKIIEHPAIVGNEVYGALAYLQLGRAQAMLGEQTGARKSYEQFLTLWKDADADIPVYQQAKQEYAKLR
jgi:tetratricopeptide (TPR) repeat protein